jgi:mannose-6-phosphate isomerase-like protein (cupin superfamily)
VGRDFATKRMPSAPDVLAPDGSEVTVLLDLSGGGLAQFTLPPGQTSHAVYHRTVEEIWFIVSGHGQMWRRLGKHDETVALQAGDCLTIPLGTEFQFRSLGADALTAIGVTMPPWPGDGEAISCEGPWEPTMAPGPGLAERDPDAPTD